MKKKKNLNLTWQSWEQTGILITLSVMGLSKVHQGMKVCPRVQLIHCTVHYFGSLLQAKAQRRLSSLLMKIQNVLLCGLRPNNAGQKVIKGITHFAGCRCYLGAVLDTVLYNLTLLCLVLTLRLPLMDSCTAWQKSTCHWHDNSVHCFIDWLTPEDIPTLTLFTCH